LGGQGFRIRYFNFDREPGAVPSLEKYRGLVVLGGWMGVYEADRYTHIKVECELIEQALKQEIPVLGICLGAQILAHVLGANVRKHTEREVGWQRIRILKQGRSDTLLSHFAETEAVFQMHGDTFDIPASAEHLAASAVCDSQAFRYGSSAYGLQFHLEADIHLRRSLELSHKTFDAFIKLLGMGERSPLTRSNHGRPVY
jgi:GMP synthase (glutamine-hydrolysing)